MMRRNVLLLCTGALAAGCVPTREDAIKRTCDLWTVTPTAITATDAAAPSVRVNVRYEVTLAAGAGTSGRLSFAAPFNSEYVVATSPGVSVSVVGGAVSKLGPICAGQADGHAVTLTAITHTLELGGAPMTGLVLAEDRSRRKSSGGGGGDLDFD